MAHKITVLLNKEGETGVLTDDCRAVTYTRSSGIWKEAAGCGFTLNGVTSMNELRDRIAELVNFMADYKIFVAAKIQGIALNILQQENVMCWEIAGYPQNLLDAVLKEAEDAWLREKSALQSQINDDNEFQYIREISSGHYAISLKEIQENNTQVTTKQALLPFLQRQKFKILEIACSHIPQWLEPELMMRGFAMEVNKQYGNEMELIVTSDNI
ncbi:hypothetical protein LPY66_03160 [Dehalobacter sp. DCM]|uniref:Fe-only nitrogenase accessory AnfO family protein n=1 Tax=Dehalobacter sp. DCM TaxID=2907827 RepID=UPI003081D07B|nr:hypothetical protein LPY66_03160 [Dehalobacter sp. DCM]